MNLEKTQGNSYFFDPIKWGINEDPVNNRVQLQAAIDFAKKNSKGRTIFKMGKTDFFIKCDGKRLSISDAAKSYGIQLPSDIEIQMTSDTFIRVEPNHNVSFAIFGIYKKINIKISGGNLIGDIEKHDYSKDPDSHEYGAQILIAGGKNITIEDVVLRDGTGDNIMIGDSSAHPKAHNYMYNSKIKDFWLSENIIIRGCNISYGGRNNVSVLSCKTMLFENNIIHSCSKKKMTPKAPASGIDFEAYRWVPSKRTVHQTGNVSEPGDLREFERIENVLIQNNHFYNNLGGAVNMFTMYNSTFRDNYCEEGMLAAYGSQIRVSNNTFQNRGTTRKEASNGFANNNLSYNIQGDRVKSYDINVSGNTFVDFPAAALIRNNEVFFHNNTLKENKTGVVIGNARDFNISNNTIISSVPNSVGIKSQSSSLNNVSISKNYIDVNKYAIHFYGVNNADFTKGFKVNIYNNKFASKVFIQGASGLEFGHNTIYADMLIESLKRFSIRNNYFEAKKIALRGYFNITDGLIINNDFITNDRSSNGIILSHYASHEMNNITVIRNNFIGLKARTLINIYGDGKFNNVKARILPEEINVDSYYRGLDFKEN